MENEEEDGSKYYTPTAMENIGLIYSLTVVLERLDEIQRNIENYKSIPIMRKNHQVKGYLEALLRVEKLGLDIVTEVEKED
jgi:hypothetical protein